MVEACERGAHPFTGRCAPLADLADAIKSISSTSTDTVSASMVWIQPRLTSTSAAPSSSGHQIFKSQIFKSIPIQLEKLTGTASWSRGSSNASDCSDFKSLQYRGRTPW